MFESVVLPAPFSPSKACTSPAAASKSTRSFATTPGNRFVIPRSATAGPTAGEGSGEAGASPLNSLTLRATDDAFHEPVHRVQVPDGHPLRLGDAQLALLVVQRAGELVERALLQRGLLLRDRRLRLRGDLRTVWSNVREAVLDRAVVEVRLPRPVHRGLRLAQVVRAPVVDRGREPLLRRELVRVGVVADPRDALRLGELTGRRTVDVLAEDVGAGGDEVLRRLLLLVGREPRVRPDQPDPRARARRLRAERERIRVPNHLGDRERNDVSDDALLRRGSGGHPREVDGVLTGAEVLGEILRLRRARRLLEVHVGVLLRLRHHAVLETERRREDDLVAVADQALDHLTGLRALGDVLLERRLHLRAERLLDVQPALVVRLRPAAVVVRPNVDPGGLEGSGLGVRPRGTDRDPDDQGHDSGDRKEEQRELPVLHLLLSPLLGSARDYRASRRRCLVGTAGEPLEGAGQDSHGKFDVLRARLFG